MSPATGTRTATRARRLSCLLLRSLARPPATRTLRRRRSPALHSRPGAGCLSRRRSSRAKRCSSKALAACRSSRCSSPKPRVRASLATSSSPAKFERLREFGADHIINYREDPNWGQTARQLTGGRGVDHVVEIGGPGTLAQSISACRLGGHIALIGVLTGFAGEVPTAAIMVGNVHISGITVGSREQQLAMIRAIEANGIRPVIDSSYPLEDLADAFRHQESGRHFGKICVEW